MSLSGWFSLAFTLLFGLAFVVALIGG